MEEMIDARNKRADDRCIEMMGDGEFDDDIRDRILEGLYDKVVLMRLSKIIEEM